MSQPPLTPPPDRLIDAEPQSWRDISDPVAREDARKYFLRRRVEELPKDVVNLYDQVHNQKREIDRKTKELLQLRSDSEHQHRQMLANWLVTIAQLLALVTALIKVFWLR